MAEYKWGMVVDIDRCIGCQACIVACWAENNVPLNTEAIYQQRRTVTWIRIERYWEGEYPNVKARYMPVMCQHCGNAPCEPVCPVYATYHNFEGLNVQIYNRCVGTRYCGNNCPFHARFFNYWEPIWPDTLQNQLNPDVTVRSKGIMEKCTMCIQRIQNAQRLAAKEGRTELPEFQPACAQACPTDTLIFGNFKDPNSRLSRMAQDKRRYRLLEDIGTEPNIVYLAKVDPHVKAKEEAHA